MFFRLVRFVATVLVVGFPILVVLKFAESVFCAEDIEDPSPYCTAFLPNVYGFI
jgi:hypothetical protein